MRKKRKVSSGRNIFAQRDSFHLALRSTIANDHPKERKKEREKAEKAGWNQFNACICIYTYPFLLLWNRALPSGRNALSARPCPGQWLSTDYAVPKRSVGDIMVTHCMQSNSPFYTIQRAKPDTREAMSNEF